MNLWPHSKRARVYVCVYVSVGGCFVYLPPRTDSNSKVSSSKNVSFGPSRGKSHCTSLLSLLPRPAVSGVWLGRYRRPAAGPKATLANVVSQPVLFWNFPYTLSTSGGTAVCTHSQDGQIRYQPLLFEVIFLTSRSFFVGSIDGLIFGNYHLHPTPSLTTPGWWVLLVRVLSSEVTSHTAHKTKPAPCLPSQSLHSGRPPGLRPCLSCHHLGSATPLLSKSPSFLSSS